MRILPAPLGAPPPFFQGRSFWRRFLAWLFDFTFLGVGKTRVRSRIARTKRLVVARPAMTTRRAQDHERQTGKHAKLPGAAHARTMAGAAIARAWRFGPACAVRFAGIVPFLHREGMPPAAHMLRRRPGGVRLAALVPQEGQAQDAAERMEPARGPRVVIVPRRKAAAAGAPGRAIRRCGAVQRRLAAVARPGHSGLCRPRIAPAAGIFARRASSFPGQADVWPL